MPYLKGHSEHKVSLWSVLKDSVGKEIWKITVPVLFNEPLGLLQKGAGATEFLDILDVAIAESDEMKRFALVAVHQLVQYSTIERCGLAKPFNPLLGETFEYVVPGKFQFLGEQVSHHPPISAFHILGDSGYLKYSTFNTKTSFGIGTIGFANIFHEHIELMPYGETFEWSPPGLGFHGLIMGSPYMEIEGTGTLRDVKKPLEKYATVRYHKKGWIHANEQHKVEGEVFSAKGQIAFKIEGKWSDEIYLRDLRLGPDSVPELIWKKIPYPENWQYMYGMTHHGL